jgi:hypothetical protein
MGLVTNITISMNNFLAIICIYSRPKLSHPFSFHCYPGTLIVNQWIMTSFNMKIIWYYRYTEFLACLGVGKITFRRFSVILAFSSNQYFPLGAFLN